MKEQQSALTFTFPTVNRLIKQVKNVRVDPLWECNGGHYVGLFRIIVELKFGEVSDAKLDENAQNALKINEIDVDNEDGYFEYAVSFEGDGDIEAILVNKPTWKTNGPNLSILWGSRIELKQDDIAIINETVEAKETHEAETYEAQDTQEALETYEVQDTQEALETYEVENTQEALELQETIEATAETNNIVSEENEVAVASRATHEPEVTKEAQKERNETQVKKRPSKVDDIHSFLASLKERFNQH